MVVNLKIMFKVIKNIFSCRNCSNLLTMFILHRPNYVILDVHFCCLDFSLAVYALGYGFKGKSCYFTAYVVSFDCFGSS